MKNTLLLIAILTSLIVTAQVPTTYYNSANGLTGYALKTELSNIISNGHVDRGYDNLYNGYETTDTDNYYENDGTVLDMYSENPNGTDPYNYTHGNDQCGNQSSEGDCYNREHLMPDSWISGGHSDSDIHHVVPSDGRVNNFRGNLPLADVGSANWTSLNGSKRGSCENAGYSGTVFEPIDEFKGDIARIYFYMATRYESQIDGWENANTSSDAALNGTENQVFEDWYLDVLLQWHNQDPVNQREIDRNNAAYDFQGNANPFISHPEWVAVIWNAVPDNENPTAPTNLTASNPTSSTIDLSWTASTDNIAVTTYDIYRDGAYAYTTPNTNFIANGLAGNTNYCFTIKAKDAAQNASNISNQACETTLNGGSSETTCMSETFENIPSNSGSYSNRTWNGDNNSSWNATNARTDQTINNRAITLRNGALTSSTTAGGIGNLTISTQRKYSGGSGTYDLLVNGNIIDVIPYGDDIQTTTITGINIENNVTISFALTSGGTTGDRVAFDDLSWTCHSTASLNNEITNNIFIFPNPVKDVLTIKSDINISNIYIYNYLGQLMIFNKNKSIINTSTLDNGIYFCKIKNENGNITVKKIIVE